MKSEKRKTSLYWIAVIFFAVLSVLINLVTFIKSFADFYADVFYPVLVNFMGRINDWSAVAFGEILMYIAALILATEIVCVIIFLFSKKKDNIKKHVIILSKLVLFLTVLTVFLFTVTWVIPLRSERVDTLHASGKQYTFSDLEKLRNYMVERTNSLAEKAERNEDGRLIFYDDTEARIINAMKKKSDIYPRLRGFYGRPKYALCSDILEWSGIGGYTYAYTKETSLNKYTSRFYFISLYSHELCHYKGYFKENEANFLSYILMNESDDNLLAYSVNANTYFQYIEPAYNEALIALYKGDTNVHIKQQPSMLSIVYKDMNDSYNESRDLYNSNAHPAEQFSRAVTEVSDYGWEAQDAVLQEDNYNGVVRMLLEYYDGILK